MPRRTQSRSVSSNYSGLLSIDVMETSIDRISKKNSQILMSFPKDIKLTLIILLISISAISQDSVYAKKIDSLWLHTYSRKHLSKKRETIDDIKIEYSFYKSSKKIRCITTLNKSAKENLLFFFVQDKIVMISTSGQQPYLISNDQVVYARQFLHTSEQIQNLIKKSYNLLQQAYEEIKVAK
jgi:hypothetical protein